MDRSRVAKAPVGENVGSLLPVERLAQAFQQSACGRRVRWIHGAELARLGTHGVLVVEEQEEEAGAQVLEGHSFGEADSGDRVEHVLRPLQTRRHVDLPALFGEVGPRTGPDRPKPLGGAVHARRHLTGSEARSGVGRAGQRQEVLLVRECLAEAFEHGISSQSGDGPLQRSRAPGTGTGRCGGGSGGGVCDQCRARASPRRPAGSAHAWKVGRFFCPTDPPPRACLLDSLVG